MNSKTLVDNIIKPLPCNRKGNQMGRLTRRKKSQIKAVPKGVGGNLVKPPPATTRCAITSRGDFYYNCGVANHDRGDPSFREPSFKIRQLIDDGYYDRSKDTNNKEDNADDDAEDQVISVSNFGLGSRTGKRNLY